MTKPKTRDGGLPVLVSPGCAPKTEGANKPAEDVLTEFGTRGLMAQGAVDRKIAKQGPKKKRGKKKPAAKKKAPAQKTAGKETAAEEQFGWIGESCDDVVSAARDLKCVRGEVEEVVERLQDAQGQLNRRVEDAIQAAATT